MNIRLNTRLRVYVVTAATTTTVEKQPQLYVLSQLHFEHNIVQNMEHNVRKKSGQKKGEKMQASSLILVKPNMNSEKCRD